MNGIIIIKKEGMGPDHMGPDHMGPGHYGPEVMANTIQVCDCILTDKTDGEEVEVTVKGTLIEQDGKRFIAVHTVDGKDVEEMPDIQMDGPWDHSMEPPTDAADALDQFMQNKDNYA